MKSWRNCSSSMAFSFWKSVRLKKFLKQSCGGLCAEGNMAQPKCCFFPQSAIRNPQSNSDSHHLQFALATRALVLFAGLFAKDVPPRRLPRKIWTARRNLRGRCTHTLGEAKIHMAACSERGRSHGCAQTGERAACSRTGSTLCAHDHDHDRVCFGKQECPFLDRGDVHPTRFLADHATDRKSTRLNSSHLVISYAVFCLKKKK